MQSSSRRAPAPSPAEPRIAPITPAGSQGAGAHEPNRPRWLRLLLLGAPQRLVAAAVVAAAVWAGYFWATTPPGAS